MLEMKLTSKFKKVLKRLKKRNANLEKLKMVMQMIVDEVPLPEEEYRAHILLVKKAMRTMNLHIINKLSI